MMLKRVFSYILITILSLSLSVAQKLTASLDSTYIEIGRQTAVHIDFLQSKGKNYVMQNEQDSTKAIEIVEILPADTAAEGMFIRLTQDVIITSFDSGSHIVPAFKFLDEMSGELMASNELELEVKVFDDAEQNPETVKDIKDIRELPFDWANLVKWLAVILLIGAIGWLIWKYGKTYYDKYFKKSEELIVEQEEIEILPSHEVALRALEKVKNEKVYKEDERVKEYYTELTDILRTYFCDRFSISAYEMTSNEIMECIKFHREASSIANELKVILDNADLAKFAKVRPSVSDCEMCLVKAFYIVHNTMKNEPEVVKSESPKSLEETHTAQLNAVSNKQTEE